MGIYSAKTFFFPSLFLFLIKLNTNYFGINYCDMSGKIAISSKMIKPFYDRGPRRMNNKTEITKDSRYGDFYTTLRIMMNDIFKIF